jgi:predicted transcriptional regulator
MESPDLMNEEELTKNLQLLGLNLYESKAYLALLIRKQLSAKDLGVMTTIPQSRTYDVLEKLTEKGFALRTPTARRLYTPVDPKVILPAQYSRLKKEIQSAVTRLQEKAEDKLNHLLDSYTEIMKEIPNIAPQIQAPFNPVWVLEGAESIEEALLSLVEKSSREFLRVTRPPDPGNTLTFDPFYFIGVSSMIQVDKAAERGVRMRWLSLVDEIPSYIGLDLQAERNRERRYLERPEEILEKFVLVDDNFALLSLRDPVSGTFGSTALMMESDAMCSILKQHFEFMWERAKPLKEVLESARRLTVRALEALKSAGFARAEVLLYETLASVGAMEYRHLSGELESRGLSQKSITASLSKLLGKGFVHRNTATRIIACERPSIVLKLLTDSPAGGARHTPFDLRHD